MDLLFFVTTLTFKGDFNFSEYSFSFELVKNKIN